MQKSQQSVVRVGRHKRYDCIEKSKRLQFMYKTSERGSRGILQQRKWKIEPRLYTCKRKVEHDVYDWLNTNWIYEVRVTKIAFGFRTIIHPTPLSEFESTWNEYHVIISSIHYCISVWPMKTKRLPDAFHFQDQKEREFEKCHSHDDLCMKVTELPQTKLSSPDERALKKASLSYSVCMKNS